METARFVAVVVAISVPLLITFLLPLFLSSNRWKAAEDKAHARRLTDAKMNARLLRLNL